jgi:hypothetical protein
MIADINNATLISAVCTTTVLPGTWVVLALAADGETMTAATPSTTTGVATSFGGVAVYDPMADPLQIPAVGSTSSITGTGFAVGMPITVMRRGRVFVATDVATTAGSTGLFGAAADIMTPSTTAGSATNTNGYFTIAAVSTTAGYEVVAAPSYVTFVRNAASGVALVEVNLETSG